MDLTLHLTFSSESEALLLLSALDKQAATACQSLLNYLHGSSINKQMYDHLVQQWQHLEWLCDSLTEQLVESGVQVPQKYSESRHKRRTESTIPSTTTQERSKS